MNAPRHPSDAQAASTRLIARLRDRLARSEETLRAIHTGDVDTLVLPGRTGPQIFTLQGAEHAYRTLIESMNEGALTITTGKMILYANQCFARMVHTPLEQVVGGSLRRFLSPRDRAVLRPLLSRPPALGAKIQVAIQAADGTQLPVQMSLRPLVQDGFNRAAIGLVVTDLSASRRSEVMLQALSRRLVEVQENERARVARELHDNITQLLCAILVRAQNLADQLPAGPSPARVEALQLRELLGQAAGEVERISRDQRPGILEHLGLASALRDTCLEFSARTGVPLKLTCAKLGAPLPAAIQLTLYRVLQETLKNVEKHARARLVFVKLTAPPGFVQLVIADNGTGFDAAPPKIRSRAKAGLGLLGMSERAAYVGGVLQIKSDRRAGTEIKIRVPLPPDRTLSRKTDP